MSTSRVLAVHGTVVLAGPPGGGAGPRAAEGTGAGAGVVTLKLVDTGGEVLAGTSLDAEPSTTPFTLYADPEDVVDPRHLRLWARLRSGDGVWGTTDLVPLDDVSTELVLTRIDV